MGQVPVCPTEEHGLPKLCSRHEGLSRGDCVVLLVTWHGDCCLVDHVAWGLCCLVDHMAWGLCCLVDHMAWFVLLQLLLEQFQGFRDLEIPPKQLQMNELLDMFERLEVLKNKPSGQTIPPGMEHGELEVVRRGERVYDGVM